MRLRAVLLSALLAVALAGGALAPAAGQQAEGESYAGTHVEFETGSNAVADYAVDGTVVLQNVSMQAASETGGSAGGGADVGLETATEFGGAAIESRTEARASVQLGFESGGEMRAHDNSRGVVQFRADGEDQVVRAELADGAEAESQGDDNRSVVVTRDDGSQGVFVVVGDGEVTVDEAGAVAAEVRNDGQLVYRQYDEGERDDEDEEAERMIQEGTATAEVYVQQAGDDAEDGGEEGRDTAVEAVQYGQDTTVEVAEESRDRVEMTVERSESEGKVVLATVSEEAFSNAQDIEVQVDGEAAVRADSYSAVEQSAQEGDQPRYYVAGSNEAEGTVDVAVGIDHFSERNVVLTSADDDGSTDTEATTEDGGSGDGDTDGDGAGFGALAALAALAAALVGARRR